TYGILPFLRSGKCSYLHGAVFISTFLHPPLRPPIRLRHPIRSFSTHFTTPSPNNPSAVLRIPLQRSPANLGIATARGTRRTNQDRTQAGVLRDGRFYFAVFDGHNVEECAEFLKNRLHEVVEECLEGVRPDEGIGIAPPVPVAEGEAGENCGEL